MTTVGDGLYQFGGVPVGGELTTGNVFFLDSGSTNASDDNYHGKKPSTPLATLDYAIGKCTANNGDIIYAMPGHAETTTAIALDVAGVTVIGLGRGRARPTFTATTGATDLINITVANCHFQNVRFAGAASGCTALVDLSTAANDCSFVKCSFEHGAAPVSAVTLSGDRAEFIDCRFLGTANGPDHSIAVEATSSDCIVQGCFFNYGAVGLDVAAIFGGGDPVAVCEGWLIEGCHFVGMDVIAIDFNSSATANIATIIANCTIGYGADTADIDGGFDAASAGQFNVLATDNVAARGRHIPVTTPA